MSEFVKSKIHWIIIGVIIFIFAFKKYYSTENGRKVVDATMLKLPVFGILIRKVAVSKFTRTMGTMLSSGVAILEALDIVAKTAGNKKRRTGNLQCEKRYRRRSDHGGPAGRKRGLSGHGLPDDFSRRIHRRP
jgi:type II secretory pathway component PulF